MFITFYSFKGGVGRSLALANTATLMAQEGFVPFLWDFDLEAPGLHKMPFLKAPVKKGFLDYLVDYLYNREHNLPNPPHLQDYLTPIEFPLLKGGVVKSWLFAAGDSSSNYFKKLSLFNWSIFYKIYEGEAFLDHLKEQIQKLPQPPHYTLIDARTGFSNVREICTLQIPDLVVLLFSFNDQNLEGTEQTLHSMRSSQWAKEKNKFPRTLLAGSLVPLEESEMKEQRIAKAKNLLGPFEVKIPYSPLLAWEEKLMVYDYPDSYISKEYQKLYQTIIELDETNPTGILQRAKKVFLQQDFKQTVTILEKKEGETPIPQKKEYAEAFYLLAYSYHLLKKPKQSAIYQKIFNELNQSKEQANSFLPFLDLSFLDRP